MTRRAGVGAPHLRRRRRDGGVGIAGGRATRRRGTRSIASPRRRRACRRSGASPPGTTRSACRTAPAPWRARPPSRARGRPRRATRPRSPPPRGRAGRPPRRARRSPGAGAVGVDPADAAGEVHRRLGGRPGADRAGRARRHPRARRRRPRRRRARTARAPAAGPGRQPTRADRPIERGGRPKACPRGAQGEQRLVERRGSDVAADLLHQHGGLDEPHAEPAGGLGSSTRASPARPCAAHSTGRSPAPRGQVGPHASRRGEVVEQGAGGVAERDLVVGQLEVHGLSPCGLPARNLTLVSPRGPHAHP